MKFNPEYEEEFYDEMDRLMRKAYRDSHHKEREEPVIYKGYTLFHKKKQLYKKDMDEIEQWYDDEDLITTYDQYGIFVDVRREYPDDPILKKEFKYREKIVTDERERIERARSEAEEEEVERFMKELEERERLKKKREQWEKERPNRKEDDLPF